jgi:hypothetical protein
VVVLGLNRVRTVRLQRLNFNAKAKQGFDQSKMTGNKARQK